MKIFNIGDVIIHENVQWSDNNHSIDNVGDEISNNYAIFNREYVILFLENVCDIEIIEIIEINNRNNNIQ